MKYIGMDVHSSNTVICVVDEQGVQLDNTVIQTNGRLLINYMRGIEGRKKVTFEECELSQWLYGILHKEADELIVCNPVANKQYKGAKTDKLDAGRLAQLLRGGFLSPVYHDGSSREQFRVLMSGYQDLIEEGVLLKNRYKSLFRKSGCPKKGEQLYKDEGLLAGLDRSDLRFVGQRTYGVLQVMEAQRVEYVGEVKRMSKGFTEIKYLKSIPGIGDIQAAKIVSQVVDPSRFASKYKYYAYCGLVRHPRGSGGKEYGTQKIWGNRTLKCVYKMAGHSVLRGTSALRKYYDQLRSKGVSHDNAYNGVCRKIAAISLSVWRHKQKYDENRLGNPLK